MNKVDIRINVCTDTLKIFISIYTYISWDIYIYTYKYIFIDIYKYVYIYIYVNVHIHMYMYMYIYIRIYIYIHTYIYIYASICRYIHIYIYMYIYSYHDCSWAVRWFRDIRKGFYICIYIATKNVHEQFVELGTSEKCSSQTCEDLYHQERKCRFKFFFLNHHLEKHARA